MRFLLVAIGSMGDNLPFLSIGKALAARGHEPIFLASGYFREHAAKAGIGFVELSSAERYMEFVHGQRVWTGMEAITRMLDELLDLTPIVHEKVRELYRPGATVVAAQGYAFGARVAQETHDIALATIHLQPMWFRGIHDAAGFLGRLPLWFLRKLSEWTDRVVDKRVAPKLEPFRATMGLAPAARYMNLWWNSPERVIGLFPDWYTPIQPDWPPNTILTGFPLDPIAAEGLAREVEDFLGAGEPPLLFSQSSITSDTRFYEISLAAARRLGRRAILLTPHADVVPSPLPPTARHFAFVPLEQLLPRSAAFIHHGGIGTIAHALRAGVPQLTVPMVYDQTDNSQRLDRLGASRYLSRKAYKERAVVKAIEGLLSSSTVAQRCQEYAARLRATDGLANACAALEEFGRRRDVVTQAVRSTP